MLKLISKIFGLFANIKFPFFLQKLINRLYVALFKIDLVEFDSIDSYKSLNELFTRKLKKERILEDGFISPSDSRVIALGKAYEVLAYQIKNRCYSLVELIGKEESFKSFINLYLSPRDYHRFHAPIDLEVVNIKRIGGTLYPVNKPFLFLVSSLFAKNERVVLECNSEIGKFFMVFIGALNVGSINLTFKERRLKKGDEIGFFAMGSSIVLLFENEVKFLVKEGDKVKFGQRLINGRNVS